MNKSFVLYFCPGACSRVTLNALEEIGADFEARAVDIFRGEQRAPAYLAVNPKGKVPALQVENQLLTENAAILYYLHSRFHQAGLLPESSALPLNAGLEDLVWCSSTLHPLVRQIRMPVRYTLGDPEAVNSKGMEELRPLIEMIAQRISGRWWYGNQWSILDVYLYWCYSTAASAGAQLPAGLVEHGERVRARPSFQRALDREMAVVEQGRVHLPPGARL
jgi:glutathione S-transferase